MVVILGAYRTTRVIQYLIRVCLVLLIAHCTPGFAEAKDTWTKVRSNNFLLVGNANEKDIREVAVRLEQFRDGFARLLTGFRFNSAAATTVVVFKSNQAFDPFKPVYQGRPGNVAGYFQSGQDVNYITLTTEQLANNPFRIIFHEYVHLLLHNTVRDLPLWFDEGLAEYYSTFDLADDGRKVWLGKVIPAHLQLLRDEPLLPLQTLLAVDRKSSYYNECDKNGIFYAQSWALVHYLILGNERKRQRQIGTYLQLLHAGANPEKAFQDAFHTHYQSLGNELRAYVQRSIFPEQVVSLPQQLKSRVDIDSAPISEAEARAYLGDLLLHIDRLREAGVFLEQALALDAKLPLAHASLGVVRVKQRRFGEAITHLKKAEAANPSNYLIHYYLAFALSRSVMGEGLTVTNYAPEVLETMRVELREAIRLNPEFPESYALLAFVNLVREEKLDESIGLVRHALSLAPERDDYLFVMAQLFMRKEDFNTARRVLQPLLRKNADATIRQSAFTLLNSMDKIEEQLNRLRAAREAAEAAGQEDRSGEMKEPSLELFLRKPQNGEHRVQGFLNRVECGAGSTLFSIDAGGQSLTLHASHLERVRFVTYTAGMRGEMTCGTRRPPNAVVVTYRPESEIRIGSVGEVIAIEFVPTDFHLNLEIRN